MRWGQPGKDTDTTGSDPLTSTITVVGVRKLFPVVDGVLSCWLRGGGGFGMEENGLKGLGQEKSLHLAKHNKSTRSLFFTTAFFLCFFDDFEMSSQP